MSAKPSCWIVTDGRPGMENQCLGLAEALGLDPVVKRIKLRAPWRQLSPVYWRWGTRWALHSQSDPLDPPWPDIVLASGRQSVLPALMVKQRNPATFIVQIQDPILSPRHFDLVITPRHDHLSGENVLSTRGSIHRITPQTLAQGVEKWRPIYDILPSPRIAVLIGGPNKAYGMRTQDVEQLCQHLAKLSRDNGAGLMVTTSFRTGAVNKSIIQNALEGLPAIIWAGTGDNPYFGLLGLADAIVVTPDSVNMVSEAATTSKPVYIAPLPGQSRKFDDFHNALMAEGVTRPFQGQLESWSYQPLEDTKLAADEIRRRCKCLQS